MSYLIFLAIFTVAWLCGYVLRGSPRCETPGRYAGLLSGHLREVMDTRTLRALKHELADFNATTRTWKHADKYWKAGEVIADEPLTTSTEP